MRQAGSHGIQPAEILGILRSLRSLAVPMWLSGGVAVDFLVGRWTRPHKDLNLVAFTPHREQLERELGARGFVLAHDEAWTTRWTVAGRRGADLEIVFVEPASPQTGVLVVPATDSAHGPARRYPLVAEYLDPHRYRELDGVWFRTCSAEGEWLNRLVSDELVPGRRPEPKLRHDLALLQPLIHEDRRRESSTRIGLGRMVINFSPDVQGASAAPRTLEKGAGGALGDGGSTGFRSGSRPDPA